MNLTSNPATIAYLCLKIDIKLNLRIKIEKFQRGVFVEKVVGFDTLKLQRALQFQLSAVKHSQQKVKMEK